MACYVLLLKFFFNYFASFQSILPICLTLTASITYFKIEIFLLNTIGLRHATSGMITQSLAWPKGGDYYETTVPAFTQSEESSRELVDFRDPTASPVITGRAEQLPAA